MRPFLNEAQRKQHYPEITHASDVMKPNYKQYSPDIDICM